MSNSHTGLQYQTVMSNSHTGLQYQTLMSNSHTGLQYQTLMSNSHTGLQYQTVMSNSHTGLQYQTLRTNNHIGLQSETLRPNIHTRTIVPVSRGLTAIQDYSTRFWDLNNHTGLLVYHATTKATLNFRMYTALHLPLLLGEGGLTNRGTDGGWPKLIFFWGGGGGAFKQMLYLFFSWCPIFYFIWPEGHLERKGCTWHLQETFSSWCADI